MNNYKEEYLIHYGIPGMKWGHRKSKNFVSSYTRSYKSASDEQARKAIKYKEKAKKSEY